MSSVKFNNKGLGECIILKDKDDDYKLIGIIGKENVSYAIVSGIDYVNECWSGGHYYSDLDGALNHYNEIVEERQNIDYER